MRLVASMLNILMELLNSPNGADFIRAIKILFMLFLALAALAILFAPISKSGKTSYGLLRLIFTISLIAVLGYQATWQLAGFTKPSFVKFMRRYNKRPNAADLQILRGPIFDRRGLVLAAPVRGNVWGRLYPLGEAAVHPLGYYHSQFGITAVERACDPVLSGFTSEKPEELLGRLLFMSRAEEGDAITLTLDQRLQKKAYDLMAGRKGAVIIMQPQSGDLLALVSSPGFDPLDPAAAFYDEDNAKAFNRAVQGLYPPGSTFKILIAGIALNQNLTPTFNCPPLGYIAGPNTPAIRDNEYYTCARNNTVWTGWGTLKLNEAMTHSSNVYFAQLGVACGHEAFNSMMNRARINTSLSYLTAPDNNTLKTARGQIASIKTKRALAMLAIGQGQLLVTPLHVACFTAAVATEGKMMRPRLKLNMPIIEESLLFTPRTAEQLKIMLRRVVTHGTGKGVDIPGLEICGKTGTAQVDNKDDHAWFTCFAPLKNPRIVVTVLIENGGYGAQTALPVARTLLQEAEKLGYVRQKTQVPK